MRPTFVAVILAAACVEKRPDVTTEPPDPLVRVQVPAEAAAPFEVASAPLPVVFTPSIIAQPSDTLQVSQMLTVTVRVGIKNAIGPHEVIAVFVAPPPLDYQRMVQTIDVRGEETSVEFTLPVAGTMIDQQKLVGLWQVRLFLDGTELSAPTFEIAP
jgi:hypothetical protein